MQNWGGGGVHYQKLHIPLKNTADALESILPHIPVNKSICMTSGAPRPSLPFNFKAMSVGYNVEQFPPPLDFLLILSFCIAFVLHFSSISHRVFFIIAHFFPLSSASSPSAPTHCAIGTLLMKLTNFQIPAPPSMHVALTKQIQHFSHSLACGTEKKPELTSKASDK